MKRLTIIVLAVLLMFSVNACSQKDSAVPVASPAGGEQEVDKQNSDLSVEDNQESPEEIDQTVAVEKKSDQSDQDFSKSEECSIEFIVNGKKVKGSPVDLSGGYVETVTTVNGKKVNPDSGVYTLPGGCGDSVSIDGVQVDPHTTVYQLPDGCVDSVVIDGVRVDPKTSVYVLPGTDDKLRIIVNGKEVAASAGSVSLSCDE